MNLAYIAEKSSIYGPGERFVIWVQGCSLRCRGCWNQEMWDFSPNTIFTVSELIDMIKNLDYTPEGITLLGGEPLDQYEEVLHFVVECKKLGLTTMLFTGYEMREIYKKGMSHILPFLDIIITGRYDELKRTLNHQWIGSTNQQIHFLTPRYKDYRINEGNYIEISLDELGKMDIMGFPGQDFISHVVNP